MQLYHEASPHFQVVETFGKKQHCSFLFTLVLVQSILPFHLPLKATLSFTASSPPSNLKQIADWREVIDASIHEGVYILQARAEKGLRARLGPLLFDRWQARCGREGRSGGRE